MLRCRPAQERNRRSTATKAIDQPPELQRERAAAEELAAALFVLADPLVVLTVSAAIHHDISLPLRGAPVDHAVKERREHPIQKFRIPGPDLDDTVVQTGPRSSASTAITPDASTTIGLNFPGVGNGDYGFAPNEQYSSASSAEPRGWIDTGFCGALDGAW
jgi:hypothetical protein